jgi:hypothetical protein
MLGHHVSQQLSQAQVRWVIDIQLHIRPPGYSVG